MLRILLMVFLMSCNTIETKKTNSDIIFKRDMAILVDGTMYDGVGVLPARDTYQIHVQAQGDLDLFTFETCHREEVTEKAWNVEGEKRWLFFKRKIEKKREVKFDYTPTQIEKTYCPIIFGGYEEAQGRHSWAFLDIQTPDATLAAEVLCNGSKKLSYGVSVCQAKAGLVQSIKFNSIVKVEPLTECQIGKNESDYFEFPIAHGNCVYAFKSADGQIHRLSTIGYDQVKVRKNDSDDN